MMRRRFVAFVWTQQSFIYMTNYDFIIIFPLIKLQNSETSPSEINVAAMKKIPQWRINERSRDSFRSRVSVTTSKAEFIVWKNNVTSILGEKKSFFSLVLDVQWDRKVKEPEVAPSARIKNTNVRHLSSCTRRNISESMKSYQFY